MEKRKRHYWIYKIDRSLREFFWEELKSKQLRQGWGYQDSFDLSLPERDYSGGNKLNYKIYDNVKKDDILLVRGLPNNNNDIAILRAIDDFDKGYKFNKQEKEVYDGHFRHIFPAEFVKHFSIGCSYSNASLKRSMEFWPPKPRIGYVGHLEKVIEDILAEQDNKKLESWATAEERIQQATKTVFHNTFDSERFKKEIYESFVEQFTAAGWENALVDGLQQLFPLYDVIPTGGAGEKHHGTDILIKIPSIVPEHQYAIAIQVKDYTWIVNKGVLQQIERANNSWSNVENLELIDKILILTKVEKELNPELVKASEEKNIKIMFANELKELLYQIAISYTGINSELS